MYFVYLYVDIEGSGKPYARQILEARKGQMDQSKILSNAKNRANYPPKNYLFQPAAPVEWDSIGSGLNSARPNMV